VAGLWGRTHALEFADVEAIETDQLARVLATWQNRKAPRLGRLAPGPDSAEGLLSRLASIKQDAKIAYKGGLVWPP
jgi:hypothetical protein